MSEACRALKAWSLGAVFLMAFASGIQAASGPEVKVRLTGSIPDHAGGAASWVTLKDGSKVARGGKILYKVELSNSGRQAATRPSALGPIPAGTSYAP